jgi:hypothetical protein
MDTLLAKYGQNNEWTLDWKCQSDIVRWSYTLSGRTRHCLVEPDIGVFGTQNWRSDIVWVKSDIVWWGRTLSGRRSLENVIFSQNLSLSSQVWFLNYSAPTQMKLGHKGHLNTRNKFPNEVFPKSNDFPSDFGWTQNPRFWGNEDKSMKLKGLESWIHSKVRGRWWGSS